MAEKKFKAVLQIGGALGNDFKGAISASTSGLKKVSGQIRTLNATKTKLGQFDLSGLNEARQKLSAARDRLGQLQDQLKKTRDPSGKLRAEFLRQRDAVAKAESSLAGKQRRLATVATSLKKAGVNTRDLAGENKRLSESVARLESRYKNLSRAQGMIDQAKQSRADIRGQILDNVALAYSIAKPLSVAVGFEDAMAKVGAVSGATDAELVKLTKTARELGASTRYSAAQSAEAMGFLSMAGFNAQQTLVATPQILKLSAAGATELGETADIASNILSGFNLKAEQTERVGDVLAKTFTTSNTSLRSLGETMAYAAPLVAAVGGSIEEGAAMAALLGNIGIQGSRAGTAIAGMYSRVSAPMGPAREMMEQYGITVKDSLGNLRSMPEILADIGDRLDGLGSADRAEVIKKIFGQEAAAGATELIKQAREGGLQEYIKTLENAGGTADKIAEKMNKTTAAQLAAVSSSFQEIGIAVGTAVLPALVSVLKVIAAGARTVAGFAEKFPWLTRVVIGAATAVVTLHTAALAGGFAKSFLLQGGGTILKIWTKAAPLLMTVGKVVLPMVMTGFKALTAIIAANPIGATITALAVGAFLVIKYWKPIKAFFLNLWDSIGTKAVAVGKMILTAINPVASIVSKVAGLFGFGASENAPAQLQTTQNKPKSIQAPALQAAGNQSLNQSNSFQITQQPGEDQETLVRRIMGEMDKRNAALAAGALHD
jgi:TP901 family phage tail tape measure protein